MRNFISGLIGAVIGCATPAWTEELLLATDPFNETVSQTALIAGQFIAGLQFSGAPSTDLTLGAFIPKDWRGQIVCARVITVEGQYLAANEYAVPDGSGGGLTRVPYPKSELNALLAERPDNSVSVRLSKGPCDTIVTDVAVAFWGEADAAPALLVNGFQAQQVFLYIADNTIPVLCETAPLETRIAYDTICTIPDDAPSGEVAVSILRIVDGNAAPEQEVTLWLP